MTTIDRDQKPNVCETCGGGGWEDSGVEYMGAHEIVGCSDCWGTGFADVCRGVEELRAEIARLASLPAIPPKAELGKPLCVRCFAYLTCPVCAWPAPPIETEVAPAIPLDDTELRRELDATKHLLAVAEEVAEARRYGTDCAVGFALQRDAARAELAELRASVPVLETPPASMEQREIERRLLREAHEEVDASNKAIEEAKKRADSLCDTTADNDWTRGKKWGASFVAMALDPSRYQTDDLGAPVEPVPPPRDGLNHLDISLTDAQLQQLMDVTPVSADEAPDFWRDKLLSAPVPAPRLEWDEEK